MSGIKFQNSDRKFSSSGSMPLTENTSEFIFYWKIENFTFSLLSKNVIISSPEIRIKQLQNTNWNLDLYLPDDDEENISLNLIRSELDGGPYTITVDGKLFIAKNNGELLFLENRNINFNRDGQYSEPLTIPRNSILENSNDFLLKDTLTVGHQFFIHSEDSVPSFTTCSARSKLCLKEYSIIIPREFFEMSPNFESYTSPIASTSTDYPEFHIRLHFDPLQNKNAVAIFIHMVESDVNVLMQCKLTLLKKELVKYTYKENHIFELEMGSNVWKIDTGETFSNSISDATCLKCEFVVSSGNFTSFLENTTYKEKTFESSIGDCNQGCLQSNLMNMYNNKILCDFKVIVSGKEFSVHKTVLSAVSPVFRAMFESGMSEAEKSQMTIEDFSVEVVEKMLEFTYSDRVKELEWDVSLELYSIADKYQIQNLKIICSSFLKSALCVETLPDLLTLADLHNDTNLWKVAEDFICGNSEAVFRSDTWNQFMKNNHQVASKTMHRFCMLYSEGNYNPKQ